MNSEEAIRRCEFWTTCAGSALGSTRDPKVGAFFEADSIPAESISAPQGARIYAIQIPAKVKDGPFIVDNLAYQMVVAEIERRKSK